MTTRSPDDGNNLAAWADGYDWLVMAKAVAKFAHTAASRAHRLTPSQKRRLRAAYLAVLGAPVKATEASQRLPIVEVARRHRKKLAAASAERRPMLVYAMVRDMARIAEQVEDQRSEDVLTRFADTLSADDETYLTDARRGPFKVAAYVLLRTGALGVTLLERPDRNSIDREVRALREVARRARAPRATTSR